MAWQINVHQYQPRHFRHDPPDVTLVGGDGGGGGAIASVVVVVVVVVVVTVVIVVEVLVVEVEVILVVVVLAITIGGSFLDSLLFVGSSLSLVISDFVPLAAVVLLLPFFVAGILAFFIVLGQNMFEHIPWHANLLIPPIGIFQRQPISHPILELLPINSHRFLTFSD